MLKHLLILFFILFCKQINDLESIIESFDIMNSDKIVNFQPSNCSITEIRKINDRLKLVKLGKSLESTVN